jgi:NAD(P)-dependent dehydrogenase (short-subunit alcohol dehydrogenase family)
MVSERPLTSRHALVTGGARGIGFAIAQELVRHGASVTLLGRSESALSQSAAALGSAAGFEVADVADGEAVRRAFARARERSGDVSLLINNAGQAQSAPLQKTDAGLWARLLAVNLTGTYHCIHTALPAMIATGFGRIVNVASTAGQVGYPYVAAYCAAKHGVVGLTRALALETASRGITVNAVCPGFTDTDIVRESIANIQAKTGRTEAEALAAIVAHNPQKRLIKPEEVANAVLWLCLPGSESITGQTISVSGGEVS